MHDPFPLPCPGWLRQYTEPVANCVSLQTLPLHIHEVLVAFVLYHISSVVVSPLFSRYFFPQIYPNLNARTKLNWDSHIVSFVQSTVICVLALWVMWKDEERSEMDWAGRVHGYTGAGGLIQAFAGGYFLWDLYITAQHISVFGPGMLAHAVAALFVFSLGFRPFVNFYAPTFILYELSSPFLNIHWFCDKLNMTGSNLQLYNGILLLFTFFSCRLCWGSYQSVRVFYDVYRALTAGEVTLQDPELAKLGNGTAVDPSLIPQSDVMQFAGDRAVPVWLAASYLASNLVLNGLNWFWFAKMIATVRKRFDPPFGTRKPVIKEPKPTGEPVLVEGIGLDSAPSTPLASGVDATDYVTAVTVDKNGHHLEIQQMEVRKRTGENERPMSSARAA